MGNEMYFSDLMYNVEEALLGVVIGILIAYLFLLIFGVASYVMNSLALHRIAKRRGIQDPWMAWIPYACNWIIGSIADEYDGRNGIKRKWRVLLLTLSIIASLGIVLVYVGFIVAIVMLTAGGMEPEVMPLLTMFGCVYGGLILFAMLASAQGFCTAVCYYKIFESTVPKRAVTYFVLYLLVPLAGPICLLACSKKGYPFPEELAPVQEVPAEVVAEADVVTEEEVVAESVVEEAVAEDSIFEDEE